MLIKHIIEALEQWAPPAYQESYDNAGLITGDPLAECTGVLCCLDVTEAVLNEALEKNLNMVVAHHPIVFRAIKQFSQKNLVNRILTKAIKQDLAIYAIHTNLDHVFTGINASLARKLNLASHSLSILEPKENLLAKLYTYVPETALDTVKQALFEAGGGVIGQYAECSFTVGGTGSFKPLAGSNPVIGQTNGETEFVAEQKLEIIFPAYLQHKMVSALQNAHPYEVAAFEVILLQNQHQLVGAGMIGRLNQTLNEVAFLQQVKADFQLLAIRHSAFINRPIRTVALCGGAGSFLINKAIKAGADVFVTADLKYHDYFEADGKILLVDIGHWESEISIIDEIAKFLNDKFLTFAVQKTAINTNSVHYLV